LHDCGPRESLKVGEAKRSRHPPLGALAMRTPRMTPLRYKIGKVALITLAILFTACLVSRIYLDMSYHDTRPTAPDSFLGRTVPYNVHGRVVYLTMEESNQLEYLHWGNLWVFFWNGNRPFH
jgi:hypothetical protein